MNRLWKKSIPRKKSIPWKKLKRAIALLLCFFMLSSTIEKFSVVSHAAPVPSLKLEVTLGSNGSIISNWSPIEGAVKYTLLISDINSREYYANEGNLTATTYTSIANLPHNVHYTIAVIAYNSAGVSIVSQTANVLIPYGFYDKTPPGVPQNVSATATSTSITISWDGVSRAVHYDILFNGATYTNTDTTITFKDLSPKTSYSYSVRARNENGASDYSSTYQAVTLPTPLSVPSNVTATATANSAAVSWHAVNGATGYDLYFNGAIFNVTGTSRTFTQLSPDTSYSYFVRAKNAETTSNYSASKTIRTLPNPPAVPEDVTATATKDSITVKFNPVSGATGYDLLFDGSVYHVTDTSRTFTGLLEGTAYTYSVRAKNTGGESAYSTKQTVTTMYGIPAVPANVTATPASRLITVSWGVVPGAASYDILFDGRVYNVTGTSRTFAGLLPETSYTCSVSAKNESGASAYSSVQTMETLPDPPTTPANVTAIVAEGSVTVSFGAVSRATGYDIVFDGITYSVTDTSYTFTGLSPGIYTYAVRAKNAGGESAYSTEKTASIPYGVPAAPANVTATATANSVTVSWSPVPGALYYDVAFDGITGSISSLSYTFSQLSPSTTYTYSVRAVNARGESEYSDPKSIKTESNPTALPAPTNVTASATSTTVKVSWDRVPGAVSYEVVVNGITGMTVSPSWTFGGLLPDTEYTYVVRAKNEHTVSDDSLLKTFRTLPVPPGVPGNISGTTTESSVTLSWSSVPGATSYCVIFNGTEHTTGGTSITFRSLEPNTSNTYSVCANNAGGSSEYSTQETIKTTPVPPASSDTAMEVTENSVTLSWDPIPGATSYDVMFNGSAYRANDTSITFSGLESNTNYTYSIRVNSEYGSSSYGEEKTVKTALPEPPAVPEHVTAAATIDSVTVNFGSVPGATGYDVLFDGTVYHVTDTSKTITGLSAGTAYTYSVRAKNAGGESVYSIEQTVTTAHEKPAVPANITAAPSSNSIAVSWSAVPGATSYDILFDGSAYNVTGTSRTFGGLQPETGHTYSVSAKNAFGSSAYSALQTVHTHPDPPYRPAGVLATAAEDSITVTFSAVSGASGYDILFDGVVYPVTDTSHTFTGLPQGTAHTYAVRAKNAGGESAYSETKSITTPYGKPAMPKYVSATATTDSVTVSFSPVPGATLYEVMFNGTVHFTTGPFFIITGLTPNTTYTYSVLAENANGASEWSATKTITTPANQATLPVPGILLPDVTSYSIKVNWERVPGATSYEVIVNGLCAETVGSSWLFTGLLPNTLYSYKVRAKNGDAVSEYTMLRNVTTPPAAPNAPGNISETSKEDSVTLSWDPVPGATEYTVLFNGTTYPTSSPSMTFNDLNPDTGYTYSVSAGNKGGSSTYSASKTVTTTPPPPAGSGILANVTEDAVTLSWEKVPGATGYDVMFNGSVYRTSDTSITFAGLEPNADHTYSIRTNNEDGSSSYGEEKTVTTTLYPPENIRAVTTEDCVTISFDPVDRATSYDIVFFEAESVTYSAAAGSEGSPSEGTAYNTTDTTKTFTQLQPSTKYAYAVRAKNETVTGPYSAMETAATKDVILEAPSNVTATSTINKVSVSWDTVPGATSYTVSFDGTTLTIPGTSITFGELEPNTAYDYSVKANNNEYSSKYSAINYIKTDIQRQSGLPDAKANSNYPDGRIPYLGLDPVNVLTGAFLWSYTYLEDYGNDLLHFTPMYDSQGDYGSALGNKWTYSFNYQLSMDEEYAYFSTPYGQVIPFLINHENMEEMHSIEEMHSMEFMPVEGILADYEMGRKEDGSLFVRNVDGVEYVFDENLCLSQIIEGGLVLYSFEANSSGQMISIEGQHGGKLAFFYSGNHLTRVSDAIGNTVTFAYHGDNLVSAKLSGGKNILFTYDENSNLLTVTDFSGEVSVTNTYDPMSRVTEQNVAGRGDTYAFYEDGLTRLLDELGYETRYFYDENLNVTSVEFLQTGVTNSYNDRGQLTEQTDALLQTTKMEYDGKGRLNRVIYPDGTEESVIYSSKNLPVEVVNRDGTKAIYSYDARGNLIALEDERGNTERFSYDENDNLISHTDRNGKVSAYTYDDQNHLSMYTDAEGNEYAYSYDEIGRLRFVTSPEGQITVYEYSDAGDIVSVTDTDGTVSLAYDQNGKITGVTDRMGNERHALYNQAGLVSLITDYLGNEYTYDYSKRGELIKETDPLGYRVSYTYDAMGNLISMTDENGNTTTNTFDAANQLTEVKDAKGNAVKYSYDTMGRVTAFTDARDNQTSYAYDAMGRITAVTDALGQSVSYTYDAAGNLLTWTDENGAVTEYRYDSGNRLIRITDDAGIMKLTYDALGRLTCAEDTLGYAETIRYDSHGNVTSISDQENHRTTYAYNESGRLWKETDARGYTTLYEYDANGNCIKITDAGSNVYLYAYDANGQLTKATDPLGNEVLYEYDARGYLQSFTDARGGVTTFEYDGNGNLTKETDPLGGVIQYSYDGLDRLTEVEDENGYSQFFTYDANGNVVSYTDANENVWTYAYDALNRLTGMTNENGGKIAFAYSPTGELAKITDEEGAQTSYTYDSLGRVTKISDALGNSVSFAYDSLGRMIRQTDANGNNELKVHTEYEYSPSGNLLSIKDGEGNVTTYTYNALGQILTEMDALGNTVYYAYDALGQVISITDAMGERISFTYTANGDIAAVTDANGSVTSYEYDAAGNLVKTIDALGNFVCYEYDAMNNRIRESASSSGGEACAAIYQYDKKGQLIREINPLSYEKTYEYDRNGNVVKIVDEDLYETEIVYDLNNQPVRMNYSDGKEAVFRYNQRGELVELKDWNGTVDFEYGKTGNLLKVTDQNGRTTGYGYDANANLTSIAYPDGSKVQYAYDANNRMTAVTDAENVVTQYTYDAVGNILSIKQPGNETSYIYNANGLPTEVLYELNDGTRMEESREYDAIGYLTSVISEGSTPELTKNESYTYDALGRLTTFTDGKVTESYTYDAFGNKTAKSVNENATGGSVSQTSYQYNSDKQLVSMTEDGTVYGCKYDKRGNLIEERRDNTPIKQYTYDATNYMVQEINLETGEKSEYIYNGLYMRVKNIQTLMAEEGFAVPEGVALPEDGSEPDGFKVKEVSYVLDYLSEVNNELITYESGFGATRVTYGLGSQRLSQKVTLESETPEQARETIAGNTIGKSYFQTDVLGSVLFVSNEAGEVLRYAGRDVWGELRIPVLDDLNSAGVENSLLFTNYNYDVMMLYWISIMHRQGFMMRIPDG